MEKELNIYPDNSNVQIDFWYKEWRLLLLNEGLRFGYSAEEVKDLLQQLFLDLLEKKINPQTIQNPKAFLIKAFKNKLIDYYRSNQKSKTEHTNSFSEYTTDSQHTSSSDLEITEENKELVQNIRDAFDKLPNRCKKVIYLKFGEGKTSEEIADITGLTKRSVYNNLFEGIQLLRTQIQKKQPHFKAEAFLTLLPILLVKIF
ncbi:MAG: sigma-70 family RNA polymerase sigma factor [Bacteroidetes bacterium]|nr:sigma-70 family RNA polymerase sigma factor [Bacteroidota bacterium]